MESTRTNKTGLFFLIALSVFSFFAVKNFNGPEAEKKEIDNPEITTTVDTSTDIVETSGDVFYALTNEGFSEVQPQVVLEQEVSGEVLSEIDSGSCKQASIIYESEQACNLPSSDGVEYRGSTERSGEMVSKNSSVELIEIVAPLYLMSGSREAKDSNMDITEDDPVYKPIGENWAEKDVYVNAPPGELHDEVKGNIVVGSSKLKPYSTKYSVGYEENDVVTEEGEAVIQKRGTTVCPEINRKPNNNPDKSNKTGEFFEDIFMRYPGEKEEEAEENQKLSFGAQCNTMDYVYVDQDSETVCERTWGQIVKSKITGFFSASRWENCNTPVEDENGNLVYPENCVSTEDIFVKMNPILSEANSFTQRRNKTLKSPEGSQSYDSRYFVTSCKALVDGREATVKCAWDLGMFMDELDLARYDDVGEGETPSDDAYIRFLQRESSGRTDALVDL